MAPVSNLTSNPAAQASAQESNPILTKEQRKLLVCFLMIAVAGVILAKVQVEAAQLAAANVMLVSTATAVGYRDKLKDKKIESMTNVANAMPALVEHIIDGEYDSPPEGAVTV